MSFIPSTEIKINKNNKFEFVLSGTGPGSVFPEADPRIRIHIKMKRIRNMNYKWLKAVL